MESFKHTDGHVLRPNGVGDYEIVCADGKVSDGFVPFMYRSTGRKRCLACGVIVEPEED